MLRRLFGCLFDLIGTLLVAGIIVWAAGRWGPNLFQYALQPHEVQAWADKTYHKWTNDSVSGKSFLHWLNQYPTGRAVSRWLEQHLTVRDVQPAGSAAGDYAGPCPAVLDGRFTSPGQGRRIQLNVEVQGPAGAIRTNAILDSGAVQTAFPDGMLRKLGLQPVSGPHEVGGVGSGTAVAYQYRIPYPLVTVGSKWAPLGKGSLTVEGIEGLSMSLIGPDVLVNGVSLQTQGESWSLTIPCQK